MLIRRIPRSAWAGGRLRLRPLGVGLCMAAALLGAETANAHRLAPSYLELREQGADLVTVRFKTPRVRALGAEVEPVLPAGCRPGPARVIEEPAARIVVLDAHCPGGLVGTRVGVRGLARSGTNALVLARLRDGRSIRLLLTAGSPEAEIPARESALEVARSYGLLGIEHLATGIDHVLFVAGLVLLVTGGRRLLATITAFTAGHSITLALATLGLVQPMTDLVEIGIAASLVVLAREVAVGHAESPGTLARRPWLLAGGFGLLHGFGFAGALLELGLPSEALPLALLSFNLGIEIGQIALVGILILPFRWLSSASGAGWIAELPATAIGSLGCFYGFDRLSSWWSMWA